MQRQRLHAVLGACGYSGLILMLVAGAIAVRACGSWLEAMDLNQRAEASVRAGANNDKKPPSQTQTTVAPWADLPSQQAQVLMLSTLEALAQSQGLSWSKMDVTQVKASENHPSAIEIKGTLKGAYPPIRHMLTHARLKHPGLTLRSLIIQRDTPESGTVVAQTHLVWYLKDGLPDLSASAAKDAR